MNLNNAIEHLISINNTDMNIHMQADELKDYLISRDEKYRLGFLEKSDEVWIAFNDWLEIVNMQKALRVEGEDDDLLQVRQITEDLNDFERIGIEIAGLVEKGDTEEALRKTRQEYDPFMADRLQRDIHHAAEDAKEEITEAYRAIRRKTLVAAAEILLLLVIVVAALSAVLINFILGFTRSLKELGTATGEIGKGNLDYRSRLSTKDELGDLSRFLDSMASDLKNATVSRDYASGIIDAMPEALIMVREDGTIHEVNDFFCAPLGFDKDETVGREVHLVAPGIPRPEAFLTELKGLGHVYSMETEFISKDGRSIPVDFSASIISDLHTDFRDYVIAAKDITERKRLERDLHRYRDHLMELVAERTMDLDHANFALNKRVREVSELKKALLDREGMERRKLGHDLHDGLGQVLTGLAMKSLAHAKSLGRLDGNHQIKAMEIKEVIDQAKTDVRTMARGCQPPMKAE
ncbi:MAG TPA: PAS domain S-box protein [Nitrospirae bacterium]|nr:PAS domain S-box protein [Nitrospirota bacterium]